MTSPRPGPTSAMSTPKKTKAAAVQKMPEHDQRDERLRRGHGAGGSTAASGARATAGDDQARAHRGARVEVGEVRLRTIGPAA